MLIFDMDDSCEYIKYDQEVVQVNEAELLLKRVENELEERTKRFKFIKKTSSVTKILLSLVGLGLSLWDDYVGMGTACLSGLLISFQNKYEDQVDGGGRSITLPLLCMHVFHLTFYSRWIYWDAFVCLLMLVDCVAFYYWFKKNVMEN